MKKTITSITFTLILATVINLAASQKPAVIRVCCFSKSPSDYKPNCYECPKEVYPNALMACVNATEMPKNISYKAADCMEKNCQVEYPTQASFSLEAAKSSPWWDILSRLIMPAADSKQKRSVDDNRLDNEMKDVVGEVFTFVNERQIEFGEPEYS